MPAPHLSLRQAVFTFHNAAHTLRAADEEEVMLENLLKQIPLPVWQALSDVTRRVGLRKVSAACLARVHQAHSPGQGIR